jgi:RNA polymerase sigma-70 factor (ECF subfamily)
MRARNALIWEEEAASTGSPEDAAELDVRALHEAYAPSLRRTLSRLGGPATDADDMLQEVFLIALRRHGAFRGGCDPRPWLFGLAVKVAHASRRRARLRRFLSLDSLDELPSPYTPEHNLEDLEARRLVHAALEKMSDKKRTVFVLYELEGWSGEEIARALDCPLNTVWSRLLHARNEFTARVGRLAPGKEESTRG